MNESATGIAISMGLSAICAWVAHAQIRRPFVASMLAGVIASLLFQIMVAIKLGHIDKLALIRFAIKPRA